MEISILLVKQIVELFIMLGCGLLIVRKGLLKTSDSKTPSLLLLYIVSPCAIINSFSIELTSSTLMGLVVSLSAAVIIHILFIPLSHLFAKIFYLNEIEEASIVYSNSGNLIIPLVSSILGSEWVIYTSGFMMVQTFLVWTHGRSLVSGRKSTSIKNIIFNIGVMSILVGLVIFLFQIQLPSVIDETIEKLGDIMGPIAMITIGMMMGDLDFKELFTNKRIYLVSLLRLIILPIIGILVLTVLPISSLHVDSKQILLITVLAASAPTAAMVSQFAQLYNKQPEYASSINVVTVILSIITMPIMVMLYQLL